MTKSDKASALIILIIFVAIILTYSLIQETNAEKAVAVQRLKDTQTMVEHLQGEIDALTGQIDALTLKLDKAGGVKSE